MAHAGPDHETGTPAAHRGPSEEGGTAVRVLLNIIWLVLCGIWMAIAYILAGIICCILIITIPFGIASFRIANYALWPFGRAIIRRDTAGVIWIIFAGVWLAIAHVITGIAL